MSYKTSPLNKIIIISGKIDSGKSTTAKKLAENYRGNGKSVGGIICESVLNNEGEKTAYYAVDIISHEKALLASLDNIDFGFKFKRFYFSYTGFEFANKTLKNAINNDVIFLDEIGYLELAKKGFYGIALWLIKNYKGILVFVIRENILDDVISLFGLKSVKVIEPKTYKYPHC